MNSFQRTKFPRKLFSWAPTGNRDNLPQKFNKAKTAEILKTAELKADELRRQAEFWDLEEQRYRVERTQLIGATGNRNESAAESPLAGTREKIKGLVLLRGRLDSVAACFTRAHRRVRKLYSGEKPEAAESRLVHQLEKKENELAAALSGAAMVLKGKISKLEEGVLTTEVGNVEQSMQKRLPRQESSIEYDARRAAGKAGECRAWEQFWRRVAALGEGVQRNRNLIDEFEGACWREFEALGTLAGYNDAALDLLGWKARLILTTLINLANQADKRAVRELHGLASLATEGLNHAVAGRERIACRFASRETSWPLMATRRRNQTRFVGGGEDILINLRLGDMSPFGKLATAHWDDKTEVGDFARSLWEYVAQVRNRVLSLEKHPREHWFSFSKVETEASKLSNFSPKNWHQWWNVAEQFLDEMVVSADEALLKHLERLSKRTRNRHSQGMGPKGADTLRNFRKKLRNRFQSLSGTHRLPASKGVAAKR